jgi:6-phosphofructokinase 1
MATRMGAKAVDLIDEGKSNRVVVVKNSEITDVDINEGLEKVRRIQKMEVDVLAAMTGI